VVLDGRVGRDKEAHRQALLVAVRDGLAAYESEVTGKTVTAAMVVSRRLQENPGG